MRQEIEISTFTYTFSTLSNLFSFYYILFTIFSSIVFDFFILEIFNLLLLTEQIYHVNFNIIISNYCVVSRKFH